jgi:hypothetical protein
MLDEDPNGGTGHRREHLRDELPDQDENEETESGTGEDRKSEKALKGADGGLEPGRVDPEDGILNPEHRRAHEEPERTVTHEEEDGRQAQRP